MTSSEWIVVIAIILGPIFGAAIAVFIERNRRRADRRLEVFKTLMRTRRAPIWADHVGALNLVEIEFYNDNKVIAKWKELMEHFGTPQARHRGEEIHDIKDKDEIAEINNKY